MSENITFSVSGSETYYHKDWLKSKGFKWVPSSKKWEKLNILDMNIDLSSSIATRLSSDYAELTISEPSVGTEREKITI